MPRQFFTLKSILTAPAGSSHESGPTASSGNGVATAVLEEPQSHGVASRSVAVEEMEIVDVEAHGEEHEDSDYREAGYDDDDIIGAPPTFDEEVIFPEEIDDGIIDFAVPAPLPEPEYFHAELAVPEEPDLPPPVARFADMICYDGSFAPLQNQVGQILSEAMNEVMRLRARAAEAFERSAEEMLSDLACTVLGRELQMAPADLSALVAVMGARMLGELPLKIRVAPEEAMHIKGPVEADPTLSYGDLVFNVEDGELDLRLGTRLAALLRSQQVQI